MKNYGGDLADIIRTGGTINGSIPDITDQYIHEFDDENPVGLEEDPLLDEFGDPFSLLLQDPLISTTSIVDGVDEVTDFFGNNAVDSCSVGGVVNSCVVDGVVAAAEGSGFFSSNAVDSCRFGVDDHQRVMIDHHKIDDQEELIRRPRFNFFQRMLQISPATKLSASTTLRDSPAVGSGTGGSVKSNPATLAVNDVMLSSSKGENAGLQISSPRNAGIKRRKSQAKKVVCIPAPAPVNSRPSGEVVPSDLWAWRKYGQKPIKGSPYPRGYYRCSSSKGCPARKQVERNRSDPNMLVITYTCDHNHPWPTQRNALAGSTRNATHPVSKPGSKFSRTPSSSSQSHKSPTALFKQEQTEEITPSQNYDSPSFVKEEIMEDVIEKQNDEFRPSYNPEVIFQELSNQSEDFFAELGELESDPMNLLFPNGYSQVDDGENKSLDPFTFYDWAGKSSASSITEDHNNK